MMDDIECLLAVYRAENPIGGLQFCFEKVEKVGIVVDE